MDGGAVAEGLGLRIGGVPVLADLHFRITPGLTLVRGGDGRSKTSLLRVLAGELQPTAGSLAVAPDTVFFAQPADRALDAVVMSDWLDQQRALPCAQAWSTRVAQGLVDALGLAPHAHKPLYMLSTGSRRKLGLVAAAASGAALTLLDTPYAALDATSGRVVDGLLKEAAQDLRRAWVVADFEQPAGWAGVRLAGLVDLGD